MTSHPRPELVQALHRISTVSARSDVQEVHDEIARLRRENARRRLHARALEELLYGQLTEIAGDVNEMTDQPKPTREQCIRAAAMVLAEIRNDPTLRQVFKEGGTVHVDIPAPDATDASTS